MIPLQGERKFGVEMSKINRLVVFDPVSNNPHEPLVWYVYDEDLSLGRLKERLDNYAGSLIVLTFVDVSGSKVFLKLAGGIIQFKEDVPVVYYNGEIVPKEEMTE